MCVRPILFALTACLAWPGTPTRAEQPIRQLVQQYLEARDRNDAQALRRLFVADVDQLVSSGEWRKGREAVVSGTLATSGRTGGRRSITVEGVRLLTADTALADGRYELTGLAGDESRSMWSTFILVRTPEGWRIAAIRNMLPAAPTPDR
jgi:uncharacterized protein (TIGR02246 family)